MNVTKHRSSFLSLFTHLLFLLLFLFAFSSVSSAETKIVIGFGDSLTEGCGNEFGGDCWLQCRAGDDCYDYEDTVDARFQADNLDYDMHNFGSGGETTGEGLLRLDGVLASACSLNAQYVLLHEGTNDLVKNVAKSTVKFNLDQMIEKILAQDLVPLVATITPDLTRFREFKNIPAMNELIRELVAEKVAEGKNVVLVELYNNLQPDWDATYTTPPSCYGEGDKLHPNEVGVEAVGNLWYEALLSQINPPLQVIPMTWMELLLDQNQ